MADFQRERRFMRGLNRTLKRVKSIASDSANLICDDLQAAFDQHRDRTAMTFEGRTLSYAELDAIANRFAHWGKGINLRRGQTVALFMPNRLEYFPIWYGLSKIGVVTALINNQLSGLALAHCLNISGAVCVIVDAETSPVFEAAKPLLERPLSQWVLGPAHGEQRDLVQALKSCSQLPPDKIVREDIRARDTALLIFTSGTTGLPKAARITHVRAQLYMRGFAGATGARQTDRIYVALPLYHATGGLCALGAALLNGGSVFLRRKFSASHFWGEAVDEGCTMFVYIGELC
ncbi:MAG: AMP-binding protein, partial [Phenylobacterium sp.]